MSYNKNCAFCNPMDDPFQKIVLENDTCYFLQHEKEQDVLVGSGVIVPKKHRLTTFDLTIEEWNDTYQLLQEAKQYLDFHYKPDGYTLGWNVGQPSNQHIPHSHFHIIPRYQDEPLAGKGLRYWLKQPANKRI